VSDFVIDPPAQISLAVSGTSARFPVRRVYCVGRNYEKHVLEMNEGADLRDPPFFFQKPADAMVHDGATVPYPPMTSDLQHEVELAACIGVGGANISVAEALGHVACYAISIDLTRRDLQFRAREKSWPWEMGKSFDCSAPIGPLVPASVAGHEVRTISLSVNGIERQKSDTAHMTWSVAEVISKLSEQYRLEAGDVILTGTPEGVGVLVPGDVVIATATGLPPLTITIGDPA
jgi:fumarylpyruvate hydrolase